MGFDDYKEAELKMADDIGEIVSAKEEDLLKRQVVMCQDAAKEDFSKFVGTVNMLEAMLYEDIEKKGIAYDPKQMELDTRAEMGIKPAQLMGWEAQYVLSLKKFKILYQIFKKHHFPVSVEAKI